MLGGVSRTQLPDLLVVYRPNVGRENDPGADRASIAYVAAWNKWSGPVSTQSK
jgi:hypothetical protein